MTARRTPSLGRFVLATLALAVFGCGSPLQPQSPAATDGATISTAATGESPFLTAPRGSSAPTLALTPTLEISTPDEGDVGLAGLMADLEATGAQVGVAGTAYSILLASR